MTPTATSIPLGRLTDALSERSVTASAPCRVDFGGTLDISTFHYPLRALSPATVNIALDLRTTVTLHPHREDAVRVTSRGFDDAVFAPGKAPYDHPLGLTFAVADCFGASGLHIAIDSTSPPKSGLGGSSVAAVALIAAFSKLGMRLGRPAIDPSEIVLTAHAVEQSVAGVPCGMQDQLAAAYGGVTKWRWTADPVRTPFDRRPLVAEADLPRLDRHLMVAYLGVTHVSRDVNSTWVRQFIAGTHREQWHRIVRLTHDFAGALSRWDMRAAGQAMNRETALRKAMTPQVLDAMGDRLAIAATATGCGARFTGAGGGGCLWALGETDAIAALRPKWEALLSKRDTAALLDCRVDAQGAL